MTNKMAAVEPFAGKINPMMTNMGKNKGKKVVLLSCHYDVAEWLQPDWIYNVNTGELKKKRKSDLDQKSSLTFGRSVELTGSYLKSITI